MMIFFNLSVNRDFSPVYVSYDKFCKILGICFQHESCITLRDFALNVLLPMMFGSDVPHIAHISIYSFRSKYTHIKKIYVMCI